MAVTAFRCPRTAWIGRINARISANVDAVRQELLLRFGKVDDPEIEARRQHILEALLEASPRRNSSSWSGSCWKIG